MFRGPKTRNEMNGAKKAILEKWGDQIRAAGDERPISSYTEADMKFASIAIFKDMPDFAQILQKLVWFLDLAPDQTAFLISDNPVVRHNHIDYSPRGSLGISQEGIEIYIPLSHSLCLHLLCPEMANSVAATGTMDKKFAYQRSGRPYPLLPENVEFINSLQVAQSEHYIYGRSECDFRIVREMMRDNPDLSLPWTTRSRVARTR